MAVFAFMMHCVALHIKCCNVINMAANKKHTCAFTKFKYTENLNTTVSLTGKKSKGLSIIVVIDLRSMHLTEKK